MNKRLDRASRLFDTEEASIKEGRAHGRCGWTTMRQVAHAMDLCPGCYVMGLLHELVRKGYAEHRDGFAPNGEKRNEFKMKNFAQESQS